MDTRNVSEMSVKALKAELRRHRISYGGITDKSKLCDMVEASRKKESSNVAPNMSEEMLQMSAQLSEQSDQNGNDVHCWLKHKKTGKIVDPTPDGLYKYTRMMRNCVSSKREYVEYNDYYCTTYRSISQVIFIMRLYFLGESYVRRLYTNPEYGQCLLNVESFMKFSENASEYTVVFGKMGWKTKTSVWYEHGFDSDKEILQDLEKACKQLLLVSSILPELEALPSISTILEGIDLRKKMAILIEQIVVEEEKKKN